MPKFTVTNIIGTTRNDTDVAKKAIRLGRHPDNDIVLDSPFVADQAAVLKFRNGIWELHSVGLSEITIGNRELVHGTSCEIEDTQEFKIYPFTISVSLPPKEPETDEQKRLVLDEKLSQLILDVHVDLLDYLGHDFVGQDGQQLTEAQIRAVEERIELIAKSKKPHRNLIAHIAGCCVRSELLARLSTRENATPTLLLGNTSWTRMASQVPDREEELNRILAHLEQKLQLSALVALGAQIDKVEKDFWISWNTVVGKVHDEALGYLAQRFTKKEIKDIVFGYGPLEDLLRLPTISEIMVVDRSHIYVEKDGLLDSSGRRFISDEVTLAIIDRIVSRIGRRIDKSSPLVDARLSDGSRVNAVIPPLAVRGPCLTIRKFSARRLGMNDLVKKGALTNTVSDFLKACVLDRRNMLVSGGTGTGKTTLLNCLSDFIPSRERVVTVEDTAELQLNNEHVVPLETKAANIEGAGAYTIRDLVRNALRMRPDRIVVGECRGAEALDMLQAMNTGHDGSLTTVHANNSSDVVSRLEVLVQMAADLPVSSIRQQIVAAIDVIVQLHRLRNGRRCVSQITEVVDVDPATGQIRMKDLFLLDTTDEDFPVLVPTGQLPSFMPKLISNNYINLETFYL